MWRCYFLLPKLPSKVKVCLLEIVNSSKIKSSSKQYCAIAIAVVREVIVKSREREKQAGRNMLLESLKMLQNLPVFCLLSVLFYFLFMIFIITEINYSVVALLLWNILCLYFFWFLYSFLYLCSIISACWLYYCL